MPAAQGLLLCSPFFCLTGYVDISDVKVEHPVRKLCPNNYMAGTAVSKTRKTHVFVQKDRGINTHQKMENILFLLQVSGNMIDMNVLMACQLLLEQVFNDGYSPLLQQLYQHLLFDFRIWTKSHFAVCLGKAG